jgi:hypothetical protein
MVAWAKSDPGFPLETMRQPEQAASDGADARNIG